MSSTFLRPLRARGARNLAAIAVAALTATLGACSDLQPIEANRCGNRIVEKGEACDEGSETTLCTAECRLSCVDAANAPASYVDNPDDSQTDLRCPVGQACGVDGLCSAPSGRFRTETSFEFDVPQAEVGDVDADGVADLIGTGATEIRIRFGDADGAPLDQADHLPAPAATGPFLLANLDSKLGIDLAIPSDGGVVPFYATASGTLQHRPSPTLSIPREGFVTALDGVVPTDGGPRRPLLVYVEVQGNFAVLRDLITAGNPELARCDTAAPAVLRRVPLAVTTFTNGDFLAVAIDRPVDPGWCVFAPANPVTATDPGWIPRFHKLAVGARFDTELVPLVWANVDDDNCPELLAPVLTGSGMGTAGQNVLDNTAAACNFSTAAVQTPSWGALTPGKVLAAGNLDRIGPREELVAGTGVFRVDSLTQLTKLGPALGMDRVRVADFNGDGVLDLAGTDAVLPGETAREAVRILRTSGFPGTWQASTVVVETLRPVAQLAVGDFDGDRIADVALTEVINLDANRIPTQMAVSVIYGQRSEVPSYQVVLETDAVVIATLGLRRGGPHDEDGVDDLGVGKVVAGSSPKIAASVLYGSAQRSLTAPLTANASGQAGAIAALATGPWANGDALDDLVVYSTTQQYLWPQLGDGGYNTGATGATSPFGDPRGLRDFAITSATTTGGGSTVIGFANNNKTSTVGGVGACATPSSASYLALAQRPALQARDLDGVAGDELLLTTQAGMSVQSVQVFPAIGGDCKLGNGMVPATHPLASCEAASMIEAGSTQGGDSKRREILAVCRKNGAAVLTRFDFTSTGEAQGTVLPVQVQGAVRRLMAGDFTGDGLEDAIVVTTIGAVDFGTLLVQCAATDSSCD